MDNLIKWQSERSEPVDEPMPFSIEELDIIEKADAERTIAFVETDTLRQWLEHVKQARAKADWAQKMLQFVEADIQDELVKAIEEQQNAIIKMLRQ